MGRWVDHCDTGWTIEKLGGPLGRWVDHCVAGWTSGSLERFSHTAPADLACGREGGTDDTAQ